MKKQQKWIPGVLLTVCMGNASAVDTGIENSIKINQLTLASAIQAADVSISSCRKLGESVTATVVDSFGQVQVVLRDSNANTASLSLSLKKAYTAVNFKKNTTQLVQLSDTAVGRSDGILMSAGGVLVKVGDVIYGAVGVSGSNSGATDDTCATDGANAIMDALKSDLEKEKKSEEPAQEAENTEAK